MLVKAHGANALVLIAFLLVHFATHVAATLGPGAHWIALQLVRPLYRSSLIEPLLIAAFALQLLLGAALIVKRLRKGSNGSWGLVQIASGSYLIVFIVIHVSAALSARLQSGLDTNFFWPASTLQEPIIAAFFYPYYFFGIVALFAHLAAALHFQGRPRSVVRATIGAGPILSLLILSAFGGWYTDFEIPDAYVEALKDLF